MRPSSLLLIVLAGLALPVTAHADAYKCRLPNGKIEISSQPCPEGSKTESSQSGGGVSPEQRAQAEQRLQRDRELMKERETARAAEAAAARQASPPPPPPPASAPAPTQVVAPGNTIVVVDPLSQCVAQAQQRGMTPRQRELYCRQGQLPPSQPPVATPPLAGKKDLYKVPEERPGVSVRVDKCIGKNCP